MLKHSLKLFFRNIKRHKSTFLINIIGLSTGLACVLLIALWVRDEQGVGKFDQNDALRYQIMANTNNDGAIETTMNTPALLAEALAAEMPEVDHAVSVIPFVFNSSNGIISSDSLHFKARTQYVTPDFFKVFPFKILEGDRDKLLWDKRGIVISNSLAFKLFGTSKNIIGRPIGWKVQDILVQGFISGVFDGSLQNEANKFDLLLNMDLFLEFRPWFKTWEFGAQHTYVLLRPGATVARLNKKIGELWNTKSKESGNKATLFLQKYSDRYLHGNYINGMPSGGRIVYVRLFSTIAIFVLIIACVNFINLSTAKASVRMNEVGIKKVVGAGKGTLVFQYLLESALTVFLSLAIAVVLAILLLPTFNRITGKDIIFVFQPGFAGLIFLIALFTALLAGSYPAFYLSRLKPISVLKGRFSQVTNEVFIRKGLVVFQFAISVILIASVLIIYMQIEFVQSKNLGFKKDHLIHFRTENPSEGLISEIKNIPGVINAAGIYNDIPIDSEWGTVNDVTWEGKSALNNIGFVPIDVGYGFIETLGIQLSEGRSFSRAFGSNDEIILNEAAMKAMGLKHPIGQRIKIAGEKKKIAGIVKDFNFASLHEKIRPCYIQLYPPKNLPKVLVNIKAGKEKATLEKLNDFYRTFSSGLPFDYSFLDEDFQRLYVSERRIAMLSICFAGLAILISCLGLFGLATFTAERKKKEIGIRKVLGQTAANITFMLSGEFVKLVLLSIVIALPIAYLMASNWLSDFAYRISLHLRYFVYTGLIALFIAMVTVVVQAVRAAMANPVEALRDE